jgi:trimeric autotransporter adhesin
MQRWHVIAGALTAAAVVLSAGCGDLFAPSRVEVHSVGLDPAVSSLEQGEQVQLQATARAADGTALVGRQIFWASEDPQVVQITGTGLLHGVSIGTTRVAASSEGKHAMITVAVRPAAVAAVTVSPAALVLANRGVGALSASLVDARSGTLQGREVQWVSRSPEVVRVDSDGTVRAARAGSAYVVASAEGRSDSAQVTVQSGPPRRAQAEAGDGQTGTVGVPVPAPLVVRVVDEFDDPVGGVEVQWSTGSGSVAPSVSRTDASGRASATWTFGSKPGQHTVTARTGSLTATFRARANAGAARVLRLAPDSTQMTALRDTVRLTVTARDEHGNVVAGSSYQWRSLTPTVATVDQNGRVESVGNGRALIVAATGGIADTVVVRVNQRVTRVVLGSRQARINALGFTHPLTAEARDARGHRVADAAITWSSLDGAVASVSGSGLVTARAGGTARIRALSSGRADTAVVQVQQVVAAVRTTPAVDTVFSQQTTRFRASATDSAGAPIPGAAFQWSSSNTAVATVDNRGEVRAVSPGTVQITATSQGRRGSSTIVVRAIAIHRITMDPGHRTLAPGETHRFVATSYAADGGRLSGRSFVWSSNAPAVATVNQSGVVTGVAPGSAEITVRAEGKSATARVNVNNRKSR